MTDFLLMMIINSVALIIVAKLFKGISVKGWGPLLISALVIGIVNALIKPLIILLTLPINILTLGLLTLFINGFLFYMVSKLVKGFDIKGYWNAFFGALIFSIISVILSWIMG
jgi:putative membrane protein